MSPAAATAYEPVIMQGITTTCLNGRGAWEKLADYRAKGGYDGLKRALEMTPEAVIDLIKAAGLRGRGGAGFPAATKWGFIPKDRNKPHYVCVNADESEPGTFSNRPIMEQRPHLLLEGAAICAYATRAETVYIYIRGEYHDCITQVQRAIDETKQAGLL